MPNWCGNWLEVSGEEPEVERFAKKARRVRATEKYDKTELSLSKLLPEPDYKKTAVHPTFPIMGGKKTDIVNEDQSWWDWRIQNWGTKWDITATIEKKRDGYRLYYFDSAWSPPVEWLETIAPKFPKLKFRLEYEEGGVGFKGEALAEGNNFSDDCRDFHEEPCEDCENWFEVEEMIECMDDKWRCESCFTAWEIKNGN